MQKFSPMPLVAALAFAAAYWFTDNLAASIALFLDNRLVMLTLPTLLGAAAAAAIVMAIFESHKLSDLGLHWNSGSRRNLAAGIAAGALGALLVILVPVLLGFASFAPLPAAGFSWRGDPAIAALLFCGAAGEEIAFRGFPLQVLMRGYGPWISILGISAIFGIMHSGNPGATSFSTINTVGFGILFGIALLRSHDLWLPIGIHFGWNAALPFLGAPLSGFTINVTGYHVVWKVGALWSGGKYGPEASLTASVALLLMSGAVWKMPVCRGQTWMLDSGEL